MRAEVVGRKEMRTKLGAIEIQPEFVSGSIHRVGRKRGRGEEG